MLPFTAASIVDGDNNESFGVVPLFETQSVIDFIVLLLRVMYLMLTLNQTKSVFTDFN